MKATTIFLCLLFLMGGSACADGTDPRGAGGSKIRQGGPGFGPPPEAYMACEGKSAGTAAQFAGPDGETITGTCRMDGEKLVLRPDRPRENSRDDRRGPPPEAYMACEGKSAGSTAQFVDTRGETLKGTCEEENGRMVLRPESRRGDRQGQPQDRSGDPPR
jgi:hypothetical protein